MTCRSNTLQVPACCFRADKKTSPHKTLLRLRDNCGDTKQHPEFYGLVPVYGLPLAAPVASLTPDSPGLHLHPTHSFRCRTGSQCQSVRDTFHSQIIRINTLHKAEAFIHIRYVRLTVLASCCRECPTVDANRFKSCTA